MDAQLADMQKSTFGGISPLTFLITRVDEVCTTAFGDLGGGLWLNVPA